ncbi:MAG: Tic22 family protein, partial [Pseudanabaena sp.]
IPVFTIVDDRNNPLLVDNPQQSKKQASFYLGADEAEVMLNQFKTAYPEVGSKAKIITRSMKDIYQFMSQNRGKNVAFKFVSKRSNIEAARSIWAAQGKPIDQVPEVPVFFATVQQANGQRLLTVDHNGGKIIPIFFDKSDLEGLLNRNRETVQKIINIQVTSLFQTLDSMITKNNQPNPEVELFQFVSSGAALDYAKRNRQ